MRRIAIALLLMCACSTPVEEGLTGVRVEVTYDGLMLDQLTISGVIDDDTLDGGLTRPAETLPETPRELEPLESVVIIAPDSAAGHLFHARVEGLYNGAVMATGAGQILLQEGQIVVLPIALGCGDAVVNDGTEECDDDNNDDGDGCSSICAVEEGWACSNDPGGPSTCEVTDCNADTCDGCCDGNVCTEPSPEACGVGGAACAPCNGDLCSGGECTCGGRAACADGQRCEGGECICDGESCDGCCDADGSCQPGDMANECGVAGGDCQPCDAGDTCEQGRCSGCIERCEGCCSGTTCNAASTSTCGMSGAACRACPAVRSDTCDAGSCMCGTNAECAGGQECISGLCVCTSTSCPAGCCNGNTCTTRATATCGVAGSTCVACDPARSNSCSSEGYCSCGPDPACPPGQACSGSGCECNATSCPDGCCSGGVCISPTLSSCATAGAACLTCDPHLADRCEAGRCACGDGAACSSGQHCQGGLCICDGTSCPGCCAGDTCQMGDQPNECGSGGSACTDCGGPCTNGVCAGCAMSCAGCCSGSTCIEPVGVSSCADPGEACVSCDLDRADRCTGGNCMCGATAPCNGGQRCVGGVCTCDGTSCPNGCCLGSVCVDPPALSQCGGGGESCVACDARADSCATGKCSCGGGNQCAVGQVCDMGVCRCTAASCSTGCCTGNTCNPQSIDTCGTGGAMCMACDSDRSNSCTGGACRCGSGAQCAVGQRCSNGMCVCDAQSCSGCCTATAGGTCRPGNDPDACGTGGTICSDCPAGQACDSGACSGCPSCPNGCCAGDSCIDPPSTMQCGVGGAACVMCNPLTANQCNATTGACACGGSPACTSGRECVSGTCTCTPTSCPDGCCRSNACQTRSLMNCGINGEMCATCNTMLADNCSTSGDCQCGSGAPCSAGQRCSGSICVCDSTSCPTGCCDGAGQCHMPPDINACGTNGTYCNMCSSVTANNCSASGVCRCGSGAPCGNGLHCAGTPGSCVCDSTSCPGCCTGLTGMCLPGNDPTACGSGGAMCLGCAGGSCVGGVCTNLCGSTSCAMGCCSGSFCLSPPQTMQCGWMGSSCMSCGIGANNCNMGMCHCGAGPACAPGLFCNGTSLPPCQCGPASCMTGCCGMGAGGPACFGGTTDTQCGSGGSMCRSCLAGTRCQGGMCVCDATSCPTGCCRRDGGGCVMDGAMNMMFCGINGRMCNNCPAGQVCSAGMCQPPASGGTPDAGH